MERCWEAWTSGGVGPVLPAAPRLSVSGSQPTLPLEREDSEALESSLATGRAVQKRKEARALVYEENATRACTLLESSKRKIIKNCRGTATEKESAGSSSLVNIADWILC
ncbi:hypothetical protein EYF80_036825 [Liparis tanakae]|uniref:Uncharacterized protein n=1 Tax=Liparis tanakae TaxID=230148 RepID=A0A4Z2GI04_9TELE|nr:hypothetical protein EYF80_036825 [Liparis tanakae]